MAIRWGIQCMSENLLPFLYDSHARNASMCIRLHERKLKGKLYRIIERKKLIFLKMEVIISDSDQKEIKYIVRKYLNLNSLIIMMNHLEFD